MLSNREIAIGLWLVIGAIWCLSRPPIRRSLADLARAVASPFILGSILALACYMGAVVWGLWKTGLWNTGLLKDTLVWFAFSGLVVMLQANKKCLSPAFFRDAVMDNLKVMILVEFLVSEYTFPIWAEFALVALLFVLGVIQGLTKSDAKTRHGEKFATAMVSLVGFAMLIRAVYGAAHDWSRIGRMDTLQSIALVPFLSVVELPFVFAHLLAITYDTAFRSLPLSGYIKRDVAAKARRKVLLVFGLRLFHLRKFLRKEGLQLRKVTEVSDIDSLLADWRCRGRRRTRRQG